MPSQTEELPIVTFKTQAELRAWLAEHAACGGVWVRLYKKSSGVASVTFEELLDEGLCFGWSESARHAFDEQSYLQKFTPRRTKGTASERNRKRIEALTAAGQMTQAGLDAL